MASEEENEIMRLLVDILEELKALRSLFEQSFSPIVTTHEMRSEIDQDRDSLEPSSSEIEEEANQPLPSHNEQGRQRSLFDQPSSDEVDEDAF
jgi:hypothetical protein